MKYTKEQRDRIVADMVGKTIVELEYEEEDDEYGGYWVASMSDGCEFCFKFVTEL